jgi:hypothetical protein
VPHRGAPVPHGGHNVAANRVGDQAVHHLVEHSASTNPVTGWRTLASGAMTRWADFSAIVDFVGEFRRNVGSSNVVFLCIVDCQRSVEARSAGSCCE